MSTAPSNLSLKIESFEICVTIEELAEDHDQPSASNIKALRPWLNTADLKGPFNARGVEANLSHHFGAGTMRRYGRGAFQPSGNIFFASSSDTDPEMITSSPCFQFAGVETLCLVVS
jgi:hypothetical protein